MKVLCDDDGTVEIRLTIKCPECKTPMHGRLNSERPWNENDKLTVIPTVCPKCRFYGRIDINYEVEVDAYRAAVERLVEWVTRYLETPTINEDQKRERLLRVRQAIADVEAAWKRE